MTDLEKRFLVNSDSTGRFIVKSKSTGKTYFVEPIGSTHNSGWGDQDPAGQPGQMTGNYGDKYPGCVEKKDSMITAENGFTLIEELPAGVSPLSEIYKRDAAYEKQMKNDA